MFGNGQNDFLEINTRFNKQDYSPYDQENDWSYTGHTAFALWDKVTVYYDGVLVWGIEPNYGSGIAMYDAKNTIRGEK